jgi:hypothetical protein
MAMRNSLSLVVSNTFTEHSEETALDTADHKPTKWLRYVDDTFVVWPHQPARLQKFLHHLNSGWPTTKFTTEVKANDTLMFWDVLGMKWGFKFVMKLYQKPTQTVVLSTSRQTTHIIWKRESFIVWRVSTRSYVRIRRISTMKLRT